MIQKLSASCHQENTGKRKLPKRGIFLCLLLSLWAMCTFAQISVYPVQVYTQLTPPYTPFVPTYYAPGSQKLKVTLVNTDMKQPVLSVYLRMKIISSSFTMITPPEVFTPPFDLLAGVPLQLSGSDLEVYFRRENARVGNGESQFLRTRQLPDNFYRFNFEVYEARTHKLLSNTKTGYAQAMIAAGMPPVPTLPKLGTAIPESNIPFIFFSWTPRHMNSVAAAYGTEYEFTLVEINDKQVMPDNAFLYARVLYTETTRSTSFTHTVVQPMLIPGMRYAWRVRAVAKDGVEDANVFKNDGYSAVSWFDYTMDCKPVQTLGAVYENGAINITWVNTDAIDYTVEYRPKGSSRWYTGTIVNNACTLYNLKYGQEYDYRVGSRCSMNDSYQYSQEKGFTMPALVEKGPNCGLMPDSKLTNRTPAMELQKGLPILAGDFPVFVTKVTGSRRFSGEGYVGIPYLKGTQIAVTFENIVVNTDNRLISGFITTKYDIKNNNMLFDADKTLTGGKGVGDIRTDEAKAAFKVNYIINPDMKALPVKADGTTDKIDEGGDYTITKGENGKYTFAITDSEGNKQKVEADAMPATIEDKNGNTYSVNEKGEVKQVSSQSQITLNPATLNKPRADIAILSFEEIDGETRFALDAYKDIYEKVTEYFLKYKPSNDDMIASAKFMLPDTSDDIFVRIKEQHKDKGFDPAKVRFVTAAGKEYTALYNDKDGWKLSLQGGAVSDGQAVYAVLQLADGSYATLARLNVYTYEPKEISVKLVPVNGFTNQLDAQTLEKQLNGIYGKIGVRVNVLMADESFSYEPLDGKTFNVTGSGLFATETKDMEAIQAAYKSFAGESYDANGLYLFIIQNVNERVAGDMPRGKQFGYLFPGADARTVAHEIGHGAFSLEHPFDRAGRNSFSKGDLTDDLMDYTQGTSFNKLEWDATRAPGLVIGLFQTDKGGMMTASDGILVKERALYAMTGGYVIELENVTILPSCDFDNKNLLYRFKDATGKVWIADIYRDQTNPSITSYVNEKNEGESYPNKGRLLKDREQVIKINYNNSNSILSLKKVTFGTVDSNVRGSSYSDIFTNASNYANTKLQKEEIYAESTVNNPCSDNSDKARLDGILDNLKKLKATSKSNQSFELESWNPTKKKLEYYTLKGDKLLEIQTPLTNDAILDGKWSDESQTKIRYTVNDKGIIQVKAVGIKQGIQLKGKSLNSKSLSEHLTAQTNKYLADNQVKSFDAKPKTIATTDEFADGSRISIGGNGASFIEIISSGTDVTSTLLKTGEFDEKVYLSSTEKNGVIHAPGLVTGSLEVVAQKVTDFTSLGCLAYDLAVDSQVRSEVYQQFKGIKDQIADDPASFVPILGEVLMTVGTGNTVEQTKVVFDDNADWGQRSHLATRGTGNAIITAMSGAALVKNLPEISDKLTEWVQKISKSRNNIRKVLNTNTGKAYLKKYFDKYVNAGSFEEWFSEVKKFRKGELNFEIHHVIPVNVLEKNKELQRILEKFKDKFDFNSIDNGIPLQKKSLKLDINGHSNHPDYDRYIEIEINKITTREDLTDLDKFELIQKRIDGIKNKLEIDVLLGNENVNNIIN